MFKLKAKHVRPYGSSVDNGEEYTIDAAELSHYCDSGVMLPREVATDLGNGTPFVMAERQVHDGEVQCWTYRQRGTTLTLTVFND